MTNNLQVEGLILPPYSSIKQHLTGYNTEALEDNFTQPDLTQYAFWAFSTLLKSQATSHVIKAAARKKFEIYPSARNPDKTAEQETFEFFSRYLSERDIALPMDLTPWREGVNLWFKICLWKKALHLLLMSEEEYQEHKRYKKSNS